jgi:hypothetical protein
VSAFFERARRKVWRFAQEVAEVDIGAPRMALPAAYFAPKQ